LGGAQERTDLRKHLERVSRIAFGNHQQNLPRPPGALVLLVLQLIAVYRENRGFDSAGRRTGPTHGADRQLLMPGFDKFGCCVDASPAARQLPRLRVNILETHRLHLLHGPTSCVLILRRACNAAADGLTEFFQVLVSVRVQRGLVDDRVERGSGWITWWGRS